MTHLAIHVIAAFSPPPLADETERSGPDRGGFPLAFIVFCLVCIALQLAEFLWPPLSAALAAFDGTVIPQL